MKGIILSIHSHYHVLSTKIAAALPTALYDVMIIDENSPQALSVREEAVRWCAMFVIVGSVRYQRNAYCMELANYAQTTRKPIVTILVQKKYKPSGAIGAIAIAGTTVIDFTTDFQSSIEILKKELECKAWSTDLPKPLTADSPNLARIESRPIKKSAGVVISYQKDALHVAEMLKSVLGFVASLIDPSLKSGHEQTISSCQVFVAVLSPEYQTCHSSQKSYETARLYRKEIIPVIGATKYKPSGWLSLAIAGKLYYDMPDRDSAYKKFYDSSLINNFRYAVEAFLQPQASEEEREAKEIEALDKQLEDCKKKLATWPPNPRPQNTKTAEVTSAVKELNVEGKKDLPLNYIHHEVTRMSFVPPKPLFDARGVPLRRKFDAMCSYQWSIQNFVRDFYMDLHMRSLEVWMDIWGGMQGNINEAMANAVECSTTIICFLTAKYQQSANCCLELKYALSRKKPVIFIRVEPKLSLLPWIADVISSSKVYEMSSISDSGKMDDGIPRINRISELIRAYCSSTPTNVLEVDVTEEVHARREKLEDALYWIHQNQGTARYIKCARCGVDFDDNSLDGCKEHSAYFMGGTIIAGRWVCCQQRSKDSPGCKKTKHTTTVLEWKQIQGHGGCFKWQ